MSLVINQDLADEFPKIQEYAEQRSMCKRKAVGCGIYRIKSKQLIKVEWTFNHPTPGSECTGEKGNCGCSHSETLAIFNVLRSIRYGIMLRMKPIIMLSTYSPCVRCAHEIVYSKLISMVIYDIFTFHEPRAISVLVKAGIDVFTKEDCLNGNVFHAYPR